MASSLEMAAPAGREPEAVLFHAEPEDVELAMGEGAPPAAGGTGVGAGPPDATTAAAAATSSKWATSTILGLGVFAAICIVLLIALPVTLTNKDGGGIGSNTLVDGGDSVIGNGTSSSSSGAGGSGLSTGIDFSSSGSSGSGSTGSSGSNGNSGSSAGASSSAPTSGGLEGSSAEGSTAVSAGSSGSGSTASGSGSGSSSAGGGQQQQSSSSSSTAATNPTEDDSSSSGSPPVVCSSLPLSSPDAAALGYDNFVSSCADAAGLPVGSLCHYVCAEGTVPVAGAEPEEYKCKADGVWRRHSAEPVPLQCAPEGSSTAEESSSSGAAAEDSPSSSSGPAAVLCSSLPLTADDASSLGYDPYASSCTTAIDLPVGSKCHFVCADGMGPVAGTAPEEYKCRAGGVWLRHVGTQCRCSVHLPEVAAAVPVRWILRPAVPLRPGNARWLL